MNNKSGIIRQSLLDKFGISSPGTYRGELHKTYIKDIKAAIKNKHQVAIVAPFGVGKTDLVNQVKQSYILGKEKRPGFIDIASPDKARLTITACIVKMLQALKVTRHGRSTEAKATNLIDALGKHLRDHNRPVCLVIDNAHRCREELFSELRDLREQDFNGIKPLFAVLLIGQEGLEGKLHEHPEVGWRTQFLFLNENYGWWTFADRVNYLKSVYGQAVTPGARENIALACSGPLEMDKHVADALERADASGIKDVIDEEVVPAGIHKLKQNLGASYSDISAIAGISKTAVSNVYNGENKNPKNEKAVKKALLKMKQAQKPKTKSA